MDESDISSPSLKVSDESQMFQELRQINFDFNGFRRRDKEINISCSKCRNELPLVIIEPVKVQAPASRYNQML
jgi:hypothetical protein